MTRKTGAVVLLLATFAVAVAHAQERPRRAEPVQAPRAEMGMLPMRIGGVERIMRLRAELMLNEAQLRQLEELRKQQVQREQEMLELRSRAEAGQIDREAMRAQMEERREQMRKNADAVRNRIDEILSQEQRDRLRDRNREVRGALAPQLRGMRFRQDLRLAPRARGQFMPGVGGGLNRLQIPRANGLRGLNGMGIAPRYYWFGTPGRGLLEPRVLRRRGDL